VIALVITLNTSPAGICMLSNHSSMGNSSTTSHMSSALHLMCSEQVALVAQPLVLHCREIMLAKSFTWEAGAGFAPTQYSLKNLIFFPQS